MKNIVLASAISMTSSGAALVSASNEAWFFTVGFLVLAAVWYFIMLKAILAFNEKKH